MKRDELTITEQLFYWTKMALLVVLWCISILHIKIVMINNEAKYYV